MSRCPSSGGLGVLMWLWKNRAAMVGVVLGCLATGCSLDQAGQDAGGGFVAGARQELEAVWAEKKPELIAVARNEGAAVAERLVTRAEGALDAKVEAIRAKEARGEPLTPAESWTLWLAVAAPFLAALAKAGLRYARGETPPPRP